MAISIRRSAPGHSEGLGLAVPPSAPVPARRSPGPWSRAWRRLLRNRIALSGAGVLLVVALVAAIVPLIVPIDPYQQSLMDSLLPPGSPDHPLGTDHLGRDVLLRLIDGARVSLSVGVIAVLVSAGFGGLLGLVAGFRGGRLDVVLMRLMDVQLAFPGILAALVIVTVLGSGLDKAMLAVGLGGIPRYARLVRGSVLALRHQLFVDAARSLGASDRRIMFAHIAPHTLGPLITLATLGLATAMLATASLSFLGLGAQPPTAEWGLMLADGRKYLRVAWWLCVVPGGAVLLTVLAINLFGDGVRDALDPNLSTDAD
jgi:peptide/nickel transport system permease protein